LPRIEWVVEAGVHDAADTVEIYKRIKPREYIGFEPDLVAHLRAVKRLEESHLKEKVSLFQMALSDKEESISLVTPTSLGAGQTQIELNQDGEIFAVPIFDFLDGKNNRGLLWLDVEGHAERVLRGAKNRLRQFSVMKIEVQMKYMDTNRKRDAHFVHRLLSRDFILVRAPIHPGFFGDVVYLRKDLARLTDRIVSIFLTWLFFALHYLVFILFKRNRRI